MDNSRSYIEVDEEPVVVKPKKWDIYGKINKEYASSNVAKSQVKSDLPQTKIKLRRKSKESSLSSKGKRIFETFNKDASLSEMMDDINQLKQ